MNDHNCKEEDLVEVLCKRCAGQLEAHEIEILGSFYEVAAFCPNEKCDKYLVLTLC